MGVFPGSGFPAVVPCVYLAHCCCARRDGGHMPHPLQSIYLPDALLLVPVVRQTGCVAALVGAGWGWGGGVAGAGKGAGWDRTRVLADH